MEESARQKLQLDALLDLTALHTSTQQDWTYDLRAITRRAADVLDVGRVGIWRYSEQRTGIECLSLFERESNRHSAGMLLHERDFPSYFDALKVGEVIAAEDAHTHESTREFSIAYLTPLGISSMLDVPFHVNGAMGGVVCCEHLGPCRLWREDEKRFMQALASLVSLAIETEERKRVEVALQESRNHYQAVVDNLPVVVCRWKTGRVLTYANAEYRNLLAGGDEVIGRIWTEFLPPAEIPKVMANYTAKPATVKFESDVLAHDGRRLAFAWVDVPIFDAGGHLIEYQSVGMDITAIRDREQQMRLLSAALETATATILITDREGRMVWANPAFTATTGYQIEEALGRTPTDLLGSGAHEPDFYEEMWLAVSEQGAWAGEFVNRRKDGTLYTDQTTISSVRDEAGEITHYVAIKEDVTERRRLEARAAQAQRLESVARMAGLVGHDFNNMLAVILSCVDNLLREHQGDVTLSEELREIETAARRSAGLTSRLLGFARRQVTIAEVLDLNEAVGALVGELERTLGEDSVLVWAPYRGPLHVKFDPCHLGQVLSHLLTNAREAGARKVTLEATTALPPVADAESSSSGSSGEYVRLSVRDDGAGMDESTRTRAFEPFFTTKAVGEGSGLGLATVLGLVQQNGGNVALQSFPGKGTTVDLFLTRQPLHEPTARKQPERRVSLPRGEGTILLVDDEQALLKLNKRLLEGLGYTVFAANDPSVALAISREYEGEIHLLLTDVLMPGMMGSELWHTLHLERPTMKCLFVSGYASPESLLEEALDESCDYLSKPFSSESLREKIGRLIHGTLDNQVGELS